MNLEVFVWAIIGGLFVATLSAIASYYTSQSPTNKQLSRDFLIGAGFTGVLFPLIPESFDEIKNVITTTATELKNNNILPSVGDPGVKVGPPNF